MTWINDRQHAPRELLEAPACHSFPVHDVNEPKQPAGGAWLGEHEPLHLRRQRDSHLYLTSFQTHDDNSIAARTSRTLT